nr:cation transporter [Verrucomicrobium spinosum]
MKITTGVVGHSYALVADGIESVNDIISSIMVLIGLKVAQIPPDADHPTVMVAPSSSPGCFPPCHSYRLAA